MTKKAKISLGIVMSGALLCLLNQNLISPTLPSIMAEFSVTADTVQWLTSGFTLTAALMIPLTAFLISRFSLRSLFTAALGSFLLGSLFLGLGFAFPILLMGRILQAVGAGIMMPLAQVQLLNSFPKERRGSAMGMMGLIVAAAPALGPVISGLVVDGLGYRWMFRGIALLALAVLIPAWWVMKKESPGRKLPFDLPSLILSSFGFGGLLLSFSTVSSSGFLSVKVLVSLAVGILSLILFARRQRQLEEPFLHLDVLRIPIFRKGLILTMIANASLAGGTVLLPILVQNVCGHSASVSGTVMAPGALLLGILSPVAGRIFDKQGPRKLNIAGFLMLLLGSAGFCFLDPAVSPWIIAGLYGLRMMGVGLTNAPLMTWSMNAVPEDQTPHGVSVFNTFRQVGGALGTALMVSAMRWVEETGSASAAATLRGLEAGFALGAVFAGFGLILVLRRTPGSESIKGGTPNEKDTIV